MTNINGIERFMAKTLDPETIRQTLGSLLAYLREEGQPADEPEIERVSGLLKKKRKTWRTGAGKL